MIGPKDDGTISNDEAVDLIALILFGASCNGISLTAMDLARTQMTRRVHKDVGMRVADYPTIRDAFGECLMDTEASRLYTFGVADALDLASDNSDRERQWREPDWLPRTDLLAWTWMTKFITCKNVCNVVDRMLQTSGVSVYRTSMGLERIIRARVGRVMGPTNEVLRQFIGKAPSCSASIRSTTGTRSSTRTFCRTGSRSSTTMPNRSSSISCPPR